MRISAAQRAENANRIRTAMDRLLRGEIPPGGKCDIKTLALESGIDRTAFYGSRPYARLREEFEAKLTASVQAGDAPLLFPLIADGVTTSNYQRYCTWAADLAKEYQTEPAVIEWSLFALGADTRDKLRR